MGCRHHEFGHAWHRIIIHGSGLPTLVASFLPCPVLRIRLLFSSFLASPFPYAPSPFRVYFPQVDTSLEKKRTPAPCSLPPLQRYVLGAPYPMRPQKASPPAKLDQLTSLSRPPTSHLAFLRDLDPEHQPSTIVFYAVR